MLIPLSETQVKFMFQLIFSNKILMVTLLSLEFVVKTRKGLIIGYLLFIYFFFFFFFIYLFTF